MKVKLTADTIVRYSAGDLIEVSEQEGKRLQAMGVAEEVKDKGRKK